MKKAILVPSDFTQNVKPVDQTLNNLDSEMMSIIQNSVVPMDVKVRKYNQILQRYKFLQNDRNKPYTFQIEEQVTNIDFERILKGIPETKIPLAKLLTDFLLKQENIHVEENGEITVNGTRIQNSNIIDIVHDLVRDRKTNLPPVGVEALAKVLKQANIPLEYIGNKNRHTLFQQTLQTPPRRTTVARQILGWSE